jgi:hypothetical protein
MKLVKLVNLMLLASAMIYASGASAKDGDFREKHPRRAEVNERVRNERKRIAEGVKSGKLTPAQAKQLEGELNGVKAEEHAEVKANGGYLTKTEQKQLNQELNQDSRQIYADKH